MPWKNIPPDWLEYLTGLAAFVWAASIGAAAKVAHEVNMGEREKFFTKSLFLTAPSVMMCGMLAYGIADYYTLNLGPAMALGTFSGWLGVRSADLILSVIGGKKNDRT